MKSWTSSGTRRRWTTRYGAAALATVTAATLAGTTTTPAVSATGSECPQVYPVSAVTEDQPVTGLTVSSGTEPGEFSGEVLGVLEDGIMPGIDMIMVRLGADTTGVDKRIFDVGIWQGMSGSPVYAEDGRLIGAVSYGLSWGPSTVAGVTPAADMRALLSPDAPAAAPAKRVEVPERMQARVVDSGAASEEEVESGLSQLKIPFGMSGLGQRRFKQVAAELNVPGARMMRMGTASAGTVDATSLVAGGNLAAAISYGDISYAGVGTATMVCGEEVVGFGHPMLWAGPTSLSLHPADAIYVQEDPTWAGFKLANIGSPAGTIDQDRMAGIAGFVGDLPQTSTVTSHVTSETGERTGQTWVNIASWMPEVALSHLLTNEDRVFDGIGKGNGTMSYVVVGERQDGTPFSLTRSDVYADRWDLTWATAWDLYMALARLEYTQTEDITITSVSTDSDLTRNYDRASIEDVSIKQDRQWVSLSDQRRVVLPAGSTAQLRVTMLTTSGGESSVRVALPIREQDAGRRGWLEIVGGNSPDGEDGGHRNRELPFEKLVKRIENAPHNDDVIVDLRLFGELKGQRNVRQQERVSTGTPVDGSLGARLRIVG